MAVRGLGAGRNAGDLRRDAHIKAFLREQINNSDRNDAREIVQTMRVNLYLPAHVKTLASQKSRAPLRARKLLRKKAISIENDIRGLLRNFGLTVAIVGAAKFEARIKELIEEMPNLEEFIDIQLAAGRNGATVYRTYMVKPLRLPAATRPAGG